MLDPSVSLHSGFNNLNLTSPKQAMNFISPDEIVTLYKEAITLYGKVNEKKYALNYSGENIYRVVVSESYFNPSLGVCLDLTDW